MLFFSRKPKTAEAYYNRAVDFYAQGQYEKALQDLQNAEALDPHLGVIAYTQGLCYQTLDMIVQAKQAFHKALSLNPDDPDTLYNLARLYYNEDNLEKALSYAEQANALLDESGDEMISCLLGLIFEQQGRPQDAITEYEKSLAINPDQVLTSLFLGKLYVRTQEYQKALHLFRFAVEQDPNNLETNYELSLCLAKLGEWEETIRYCRRTIEIDPTSAKAYNQLGLSLYCTHQYEEAIQYYLQALAIDPNYSTALNNLAYTYEKLQEFNKAIEMFSRYLETKTEPSQERKELIDHIELLKGKLAETTGP